MLEILSFNHRERALPPSTEVSVLIFVEKKYNEAFRGVFLENRRESLTLNVVLVLESKVLYCLSVTPENNNSCSHRITQCAIRLRSQKFRSTVTETEKP